MIDPSPEKKKFGCWLSKLMTRQQQMRSAQAALNSSALVDAAKPTGSLTRSGITLAELKPGECGYIQTLAGSSVARLRLLEMGLTPGTHVKVVRAAAFGGPLDVHVRNYQLSLRREEAAAVWLGNPDPDVGDGK